MSCSAGYTNEVSTNEQQQILNRVGHVPPVLHQFDRSALHYRSALLDGRTMRRQTMLGHRFPHLGAFFDRQWLLHRKRERSAPRTFGRVKDLT